MRIPIGLVLVLTLAVSTACSGKEKGDNVATAGGGSPRPSASGSAGTTDPDQARKFAQCVRDNGVPDFPDPGPDGQFDISKFRGLNLDQEKLSKATEACRAVAPNGGQPMQLDANQQEQLRQFAQCMRDHGIDMADPDPNGGGFGGQNGRPQFDTSDPKFQKAMEACQDKLTFLQGGGS